MESVATLPLIKTNPRVSSIDVLRGLVMVLMALDHTREFLHKDALLYQPTDLELTTPELFFTRWITHFCAPAFVFLAGTAAYLSGRKKTPRQLSSFLLTRGLWLIFLEITVINFSFWFDITFMTIELQVIWAIGVSMVVLSGLLVLPKQLILGIGLCIVFGHNLLDSFSITESGLSSLGWLLLHQRQIVPLTAHFQLSVLYPVLPWVGIMALGYCFGELYSHGFRTEQRKKMLFWLGMAALVGFVALRIANGYGDPVRWTMQKKTLYSVMSFLNVSKYPASLSYVLVTLGATLLVLRWLEGKHARGLNFLAVYGRVPLFYYVLHFYLIHLLSVGYLLGTGVPWPEINFQNGLGGVEPGQGLSLEMTYLAWILVVLTFYPLCFLYNRFKSQKRSRIWSYL
ncbi:MAG: heparan-alpha-glucosaminide N-acetyltransferase domain-containing protein [Dyadobacter sp.]|uniref:DUF1624 domain-containing protein n=1 Tax=Dyadobacter sp. TaxID=1914288 RepID=UPI0032658530